MCLGTFKGGFVGLFFPLHVSKVHSKGKHLYIHLNKALVITLLSSVEYYYETTAHK